VRQYHYDCGVIHSVKWPISERSQLLQHNHHTIKFCLTFFPAESLVNVPTSILITSSGKPNISPSAKVFMASDSETLVTDWQALLGQAKEMQLAIDKFVSNPADLLTIFFTVPAFIRFSKNLNLENDHRSGAPTKDLESCAVMEYTPSNCMNNHIACCRVYLRTREIRALFSPSWN